MNELERSKTREKQRNSRKMPSTRISELRFIPDYCDYCGCCVAVCPVDCIELEEARLTIDFDHCTFCGNCPFACPVGALVGVEAA